MLPIINEDIIDSVIIEVSKDLHMWRKKMIHYIKEENPEINTAIINIAQNTDLDPKAVATGAYITYMLLEKASQNDGSNQDFDE